jgi:hypothetical protein
LAGAMRPGHDGNQKRWEGAGLSESGAELVRWARYELGEEEWQKLVRWRRGWDRLRAVISVTTWGLVVVILVVVVDGLSKGCHLEPYKDWEELRGLLPGKLSGVLFALLGVLGLVHFGVSLIAGRAQRAARRRTGRMIERLAEKGHSPDAIWQVLWGDVLAEEAESLSREQAEQREFEADSRVAPSWWRRELSGAHLVWWAALGVLLASYGLLSAAPDWLVITAWVVLFFGIIFKVAFGWVMYVLLIAMPGSRRRMTRYYRWWARGWKPVAIALAPAVVLLVVALVGWWLEGRS